MSFPYKNILLIGATSGIGASLANKLISHGAKVTAVGSRQDRLDAFTKKHGEQANAIQYDITDTAGLDNFIQTCVNTPPFSYQTNSKSQGNSTPHRLRLPQRRRPITHTALAPFRNRPRGLPCRNQHQLHMYCESVREIRSRAAGQTVSYCPCCHGHASQSCAGGDVTRL